MNYVDYDVITPENIKKIKRHRYFRGINTLRINRIIYRDIIECITTSLKYNKYQEVLIIRSTRGNKGINYGDYKEVSMTNRMLNIALNEYSYVVHNHPTENSFSDIDIRTFLRYDNIGFMIICTNTCKYTAIMIKTKNIGKVVANRIIKKIKGNDKDSFEKNIHLLSTIGIEYRWYANY